MYESFYGFKEKPFNTLPDPDFLYLSPKHEMALTYLEYGLSSQAGFMVLTGEVGSGKTTLINYLIEKLDNRSIKVALLFNTNIQPLDFLESISKEWGANYARAEKAALYDALNDFLLNEYKKKTRVILIIDEAQNLPFETLEEIRMISNLNDEKTPLLHIILSGQPNLLRRLNNPKLEQLRQRVAVHYHLDPLDKKETLVYIEHRLKKAQAHNVNIFTPDAIDSIYEHSGGIPRIINLICDLSLVYGYAEQINPIDRNTVNMVVEDRKKMGLDFGGTARISSGSESNMFDIDADKIVSLGRKYKELSDNVYELALLMKKMIGIRDSVEKHQQEIKHLYKKIMNLEEQFSASSYQKMFQDIMQQWDAVQAARRER